MQRRGSLTALGAAAIQRTVEAQTDAAGRKTEARGWKGDAGPRYGAKRHR